MVCPGAQGFHKHLTDGSRGYPETGRFARLKNIRSGD